MRLSRTTIKGVVIPFAAALFLTFAAGHVLGVTGKPPSGLVKKSFSGLSDLLTYSRDAWLQRPSQHLRPRKYPGDGVTLSDPAAMQPGVTFVSGVFGQTLGFRLYAADGTILKEWPIDFFTIAPDQMKHRYHALIHGEHLFPSGEVVANLDGHGMVRFDACGRILWRNFDKTHHALWVDDEGFLWAPIHGDPRIDPAIAPTEFTADHIARFDPGTGEKLEDIDLVEALMRGPGPGLIQTNLGRLDDLLHVNDIEILSAEHAAAFPMFKAGDILISSRNISQVWVIDRSTHAVKWWSAGPMLSQHDADFLPDGTISLFDNRPSGATTADSGDVGALGGSRIISVSPETGDVRVDYQSDGRNSFYTPYRGKQERQPNGNLLITETDSGRAFEVTRDGRPVWTLVNGWDDRHVAWVMGAARLPPDYAAIADIRCEN